jgi:hypothetical protein
MGDRRAPKGTQTGVARSNRFKEAKHGYVRRDDRVMVVMMVVMMGGMMAGGAWALIRRRRGKHDDR